MKSQYIQQITAVVTMIAQSFSQALALKDTYYDRGYGTGGANTITDADLAGTGLTPAEIASAITLFEQLQALRHNGAVVPGDYDSTLNKLRRDL
jgi:hypothetical protein